MRTVLVVPFEPPHLAVSGFAASRFATARHRRRSRASRTRQPPSAQNPLSVAGMLVQDVRAERVGKLRRQHRVEQEPLDVVGMRERVGQRELRPVRHPEEPDLVDAERLPDGLEILGVIVRAVEVPLRAERVGAARQLSLPRRRM